MFLLTKIFSINLPKNEPILYSTQFSSYEFYGVSLLNFDHMVSYDYAVKEKDKGCWLLIII